MTDLGRIGKTVMASALLAVLLTAACNTSVGATGPAGGASAEGQLPASAVADPAGAADPVAPGTVEGQDGEGTPPEPPARVPGFLLISSIHRPGGYIEAIAPRAAEAQGARLILMSPGGEILRTVEGVEAGGTRIEPFYYFILGLDSWLSPGRYSMDVEYDVAGATRTYRRFDLRIADHEFRSMTISLNNRLTDIRTDDSAERRAQSEALSDLLFRVDADARDILASPVRRLPLDSIFYTSTFGDRRVYRYADGRNATSIHNGLDFRAPVGEPVYAPLSGTVVMAERRIVTGNTVVLRHLPGVYSLYYHLEDLSVDEGQTVSAGDILGTAGMTGLATGSHLHWEIRIGGAAVDPDLFMAAALLDIDRLLPVLSGQYQ
jgi:hypothetical protein